MGKKMGKTSVSVEYCPGVDLEAVIISGDWEGDPSIPGGVRKIPPYVDDMQIVINGEDWYDLFKQESIDKFCDILLDEYSND